MPVTAAAVATGPAHPLEISTIELDAPRADEVLVRIHATGICHTDLTAAAGRLPVPTPVVLGHEGAGVVVEVGDGVDDLAPGDHVVLAPARCGVCRQCQIGRTTYCDEAATLVFGSRRADGSTKARANGAPVHASFFGQSSFARHALVHRRSVLRVDPGLPLTELAALVCGVSTGAGAVINTLAPSASSSLAVFGVGSVGLAAVMAARMIGVGRIIAVDRHPARLELARTLGATGTITATDDLDLADALLSLQPGGYSHAFDTTGVPTVLAAAVSALSSGGMCGFVAGANARLELDLGPMLVKGARLQGIMGGDATGTVFLDDLIAAYAAGHFPVAPLIAEYGLDDINRAFDDMRSGASIKPVIVM